jgi:hypothetical protein
MFGYSPGHARRQNQPKPAFDSPFQPGLRCTFATWAPEVKMADTRPVSFDIVPHPRCRGEWWLKPARGAPFGLWYRDRDHAISYAEWVAREVDLAQIRVFNRGGTLAESRVVGRSLQEMRVGA